MQIRKIFYDLFDNQFSIMTRILNNEIIVKYKQFKRIFGQTLVFYVKKAILTLVNFNVYLCMWSFS